MCSLPSFLNYALFIRFSQRFVPSSLSRGSGHHSHFLPSLVTSVSCQFHSFSTKSSKNEDVFNSKAKSTLGRISRCFGLNRNSSIVPGRDPQQHLGLTTEHWHGNILFWNKLRIKLGKMAVLIFLLQSWDFPLLPNSPLIKGRTNTFVRMGRRNNGQHRD